MSLSIPLTQLIAMLAVGGIPVTAILLILLLCPEKLEKWSIMLWRIVFFVFRYGSKKVVQHDIQGKVNDFARTLGRKSPGVGLPGVQIQWVTGDETEEHFYQKGGVVLRLRQHRNQESNFVNAAVMYLKVALVPRAKQYLSKSQRESIDLFVGRKLFEKEAPSLVDTFFRDVFAMSFDDNDKIAEFLEKYESIDKVGMFFPVFLQEVKLLGDKVFFQPRKQKIMEEVTHFVEFLRRYAMREIGEEMKTEFEGSYCRCAIVIIAKRFKREIGETGPYVSHLRRLVQDKRMENLYVIGNALDGNKEFIDQVVLDTMNAVPLQRCMAWRVKAHILRDGVRVLVDDYLVLLRSLEGRRYYDQEFQESVIGGSC